MPRNQISAVQTLARVARILEESEDLLLELIAQMEPEDGLIWVYDAEDDETPALSSDGIDCIRDLIAEHRRNQDPD